jgi:hypothetical protein
MTPITQICTDLLPYRKGRLCNTAKGVFAAVQKAAFLRSVFLNFNNKNMLRKQTISKRLLRSEDTIAVRAQANLREPPHYYIDDTEFRGETRRQKKPILITSVYVTKI